MWRLLSICLLFARGLGDAWDPEQAAQLFISPLTGDLEVVTQVSSINPFVGQQFSIIYTLRALKAPSAVDLDPQQYSGFWTEPAPLSGHQHPDARLQNGRKGSEYLLRQVIAFPLWPGSLVLPPLRVKIKTSDSRASADEWDIVGTTNPVPISAKALPFAAVRPNIPPLVGEIEGSLSSEGSAAHPYLLLELKGTANLALFEPGDWLKAPPGGRWSIRLKDWDSTVQTRDTGGRRQLNLLQWRRWTIRPGGSIGTVHVEDLQIPVFQPVEGQWVSIRVQGQDIKRASRVPENPSAAGPHGAGDPPRRLSVPVKAAILAAFFVLSILALWRSRAVAAKSPRSR